MTISEKINYANLEEHLKTVIIGYLFHFELDIPTSNNERCKKPLLLDTKFRGMLQ